MEREDVARLERGVQMVDKLRRLCGGGVIAALAATIWVFGLTQVGSFVSFMALTAALFFGGVVVYAALIGAEALLKIAACSIETRELLRQQRAATGARPRVAPGAIAAPGLTIADVSAELAGEALGPDVAAEDRARAHVVEADGAYQVGLRRFSVYEDALRHAADEVDAGRL